MSKELTARQREIFEFIKQRMSLGGLPPTVREIGEKCHINSTNGVTAILVALIQKGYIRKIPKVSRGLKILKEKESTPGSLLKKESHSDSWVDVPVVGRVAAGTPITAIENLEGTVRVDQSFLLGQPNVIALRVQGESMKNAGIKDGDLVFARRQPIAEVGQIVVALIGEESTVKYYYPEKDQIRLEPANEAFNPLIIGSDLADFRIVGRVIAVQRTYSL